MRRVNCAYGVKSYLENYNRGYDNAAFRALSSAVEVWIGSPSPSCPQYDRDLRKGGRGKAHHAIVMVYLQSADAICMGDTENYFKLLAKRDAITKAFPKLTDYGDRFLLPFRKAVHEKCHGNTTESGQKALDSGPKVMQSL